MKLVCSGLFVLVISPLFAQEADSSAIRQYELPAVNVVELKPSIPGADKALELSSVENIIQRLSRVELIRRGAYAPDLQVGGLRYDQINLTVDGMQIFGACTDRMDPVSSYVESQNLSAIELGTDADAGAYGANLGASVNMKLNKPDFTKKGLTGAISSSIASNNLETSNNLSLNYAQDKWAIRLFTGYRSADEMKAGGGVLLPYSQYNKTNTGLSISYKMSERWLLDANGIFDYAWNIGYPALPMDVSKAIGKIGSLALRHYGAKKLERWETKVYFSDIYHEMDDSKRPDVPIRMDMPGWSKTVGMYSDLNYWVNEKTTLRLKGEAYRNWRRAEMTMYPPDEIEMFMLTWPDTYQDAISLFVQPKYEWNKKWATTLSGRMQYQHTHLATQEAIDYMQILGAEYYERYFMLWSAAITQKWTFYRNHTFNVSANYSERAPSLSELFGFYLFNAQDGYDYIGYSSLEKEKALSGTLYYANQCHAWSYQAGAEIRQVNNYIFGRTDAILDPMTIGANGVRVYENLDYAVLANAFGVLRWSNEKWTSDFKAAYYFGQFAEGAPMPLISPFSSELKLRRKVGKWGDLMGSALLNTAQNRINVAFGEDSTPSFFVLNLGWRKDFAFEKQTLFAQIELNNLTDEAYHLHASWNNVPEIGRQVVLKLRLEF